MEKLISRLRFLIDVIFTDFLLQFNEGSDALGKQLSDKTNKKIINDKIDEMVRNNETSKDFKLSNNEKVTLKIE